MNKSEANYQNLLVSLVVIAILVAAVIWLAPSKQKVPKDNNTGGDVCTLDAKICPDGSAVGRVPPSCEFAFCPSAVDTTGWKSADSTSGSFKYPANIGTKYIFTTDWPPALQVLDTPYSCTEGGSESASAGITAMKTINGKDFCVTKESGGAAGSIYTQYAYAFSMGGREAILTFSLRFSQCGNYDASQMKECQEERDSFSIDGTVFAMAKTLTLK